MQTNSPMQAKFFRENLRSELDCQLEGWQRQFPKEETLRIDLHCHDKNSDIPDELWGRILRLPETWLEPLDLVRCLKQNAADVLTVTNHNNARSCWALQDAGHDILPAAEFSCHFPDFNTGVHILTYGFSPEQEEKLKVLRKDAYRFLQYTAEHQIPTSLAHPLYVYSQLKNPQKKLYEVFALVFQSFEVLNGQRDSWQNLVTSAWVESLDEETLAIYAKRHGIRTEDFCAHKQKFLSGGSDDHFGLFAGSCGTLLHVPDLANKKKKHSLSFLALESLRSGSYRPFGNYSEEEKLTVAFLDYFCQVALNMEDPGLFRMFLHRGTLNDKLMCLLIGNGMQELRRHSYTMKFLKAVHEALGGKKPGLFLQMSVKKEYRPFLNMLHQIAGSRKNGAEAFLDVLRNCLPKMFHDINHIVADRIEQRTISALSKNKIEDLASGQWIKQVEVPSHLRALFDASASSNTPSHDISHIDLAEALDHLSFPVLAASILGGAAFASFNTLFKARPLVNTMTKNLGRFEHPRRALWISDTLFDKNGVSSVLQSNLERIRELDLPIDFMVCSNDLQSGPHLNVIKPIRRFQIPGFESQAFHFPDLMEAQKLFLMGGYDRIICSTELLMGPLALYLKHAFNVPAYFYMHTDWLDYFEKSAKLDVHGLDRVRRMLRLFYRSFDGIFVLNSQHQEWLASSAIGVKRSKIFRTAHWADKVFESKQIERSEIVPGLKDTDHVLLFAGRLSEEKGVNEMIPLYSQLSEDIPNLKIVFAGTGPAESVLKSALPQAIFTGWINKESLASLFSVCDLLVLPSRFDTFGCVVLEAISCGLPVAAYSCKGPKDIIEHELSGLLSNSQSEMLLQIKAFFKNPLQQSAMRAAALQRSSSYNSDTILKKFVADLDFEINSTEDHFSIESDTVLLTTNSKKQVSENPIVLETI